jgi:hypothetical protein
MPRGYFGIRQMNLLGRGEIYMRRNSIYPTIFLTSQAQLKLKPSLQYECGKI